MGSSPVLFEDDISKAVECLKRGGIILYPTDTIWGLGCDATNPEAVKKIYNLKKRDDEKSMLVLVDSIESLEKIIPDIPAKAYKLIADAKQPLTVIYERADGIAPNLLATDGSLGVRVTDEKFSKELCRQFNKALVSTSANISGAPTPYTFKEISEIIKEGVDYIVTYRRNDESKAAPSHIIKLSKEGSTTIIR